MKVRSYPGRAVLEDPELLLDPDATRGRAMELLYEASWRECGVNWASNARSKPPSREDEYRQPYAEVISQLEGVLEGSRSSAKEDTESRRSSSTGTTDSESSELNQTANGQGGFLIPRPRLIVPVHTYARRRRTGAPPPARRRQIREGIPDDFLTSLETRFGPVRFVVMERGRGRSLSGLDFDKSSPGLVLVLVLLLLLIPISRGVELSCGITKL